MKTQLYLKIKKNSVRTNQIYSKTQSHFILKKNILMINYRILA